MPESLDGWTLADVFTVGVRDRVPDPAGMIDASGDGWRWLLPVLGPTTSLLLRALLAADGKVLASAALAWELGVSPHQLQTSARRLELFSGLTFDPGTAGTVVRPNRWMRPLRPKALADAPQAWVAAYSSAVLAGVSE